MKKLLKTIPYIILAVLVGVTAVYATPSISKLTPSDNGVTNAMYSLQDIYNLATDGTPADEKTGDITSTPDVLNNTGVTLTEVYNAVVDALDTPTLTWQPVVTGGDPVAVIPLNLCWSYNAYEIESGCTVGNGFIDADPTDGVLPLGAVEYCQYLNENGTTLAQTPHNPAIWHLPTIQEYASITDYTKFNNATAVTGFALGGNYWSGTQDAEYADNTAWIWYSWDGSTNFNDKNLQYSVRCVR